MTTYRVGSSWGITIVREGTSEPDADGRRADDELVAVVTNGDLELAARVAELLNGLPVAAELLAWLDAQYEQARAAARDAADGNAAVRHAEGRRAANERSAFHASATARMVALGEVRARLGVGAAERPAFVGYLRCGDCQGCPVCHGPVEREVVEREQHGVLVAEPGRWQCVKGCDPRAAQALNESAQRRGE